MTERPDLEFYAKQGNGAVSRLAKYALDAEARLKEQGEALSKAERQLNASASLSPEAQSALGTLRRALFADTEAPTQADLDAKAEDDEIERGRLR